MTIIEIIALNNGAHRNQTGNISVVPDGWAVLPEEMETLNFPFGEITVEDIDGVMTVTSWKAGTVPSQDPAKILNNVKSTKLAEISKSCEDYIYAGTDVTLPDNTIKHFTYTLADQSNISEMFTAIMAGATEYPYHADSEICKIYTKEQIITIYGTLSLFKTEATTYHNSLKAQINAMTDADVISAIKFKETELTGEYLTNYTAMMASAQTQLNAILAKIPSDEAV